MKNELLIKKQPGAKISCQPAAIETTAKKLPVGAKTTETRAILLYLAPLRSHEKRFIDTPFPRVLECAGFPGPHKIQNNHNAKRLPTTNRE
jgi:hypothetical protein